MTLIYMLAMLGALTVFVVAVNVGVDFLGSRMPESKWDKVHANRGRTVNKYNGLPLPKLPK
jgi:hypothetical protein